MVAIMTNQQQTCHRIEEIDPRLVVPLCIRENRLEEDYLLPPESPPTSGANPTPVLFPSPTSIIEAIDCLPQGIDRGDKASKKASDKQKRSKGKLFRKNHKSAKVEAERVKEEVLRRAALRLQEIQEDEVADFAKLRWDEGEGPKLDMLVQYPLTLMEEVLNMPVPEHYDTGNEDGEEVEGAEETHVKASKPNTVEPDAAPALVLGEHESNLHKLRVSQRELRHFVSHPTKFAQLQKELRDRRCITDETLRQQLHIFCQKDEKDEYHDIFSEPANRNRGWSCELPRAYRRINKVQPEVIDWSQTIENNPEFVAAMIEKTSKAIDDLDIKKKDNDREYQDEVDKSDMEINNRDNLRAGVELLSYCVRDLVPIVEEQEVFFNLQVELRKIGAVTNEVLKQGLHFYVRDVRLQKEREQAIKENALTDLLLDASPIRATATTGKRRPLLKKLKFRSRRKYIDSVRP